MLNKGSDLSSINQMSEFRSQMSDVRRQKSEVRSQR